LLGYAKHTVLYSIEANTSTELCC